VKTNIIPHLTDRKQSEENSESRLATQVIHDRKDRIRRALIIYLAIAVGKLPAWSNFWQEQQKPWLPASSDIFKRSLESLEIFDKEASSAAHKFETLVFEEFAFLDALEKGKRGLPWNPTEPGLDDQKLFSQAMRNVLTGPLDLRSKLQCAVEEFEYLLKPILRASENMLKPLGVKIVESTLGEENQSLAAAIKDLLECIEAAEKKVQAVQQKLRETLEKRPRFEEIDSELQSAGKLLRYANTTFNTLGQGFVEIHNEIAEDLESRGVIETHRGAVSLTGKSFKHPAN
jgi:hypothetical protein